MKPIEALETAIERGICVDTIRKQPGKVIEHCPPDVREALTKLTSDEALSIRLPWGKK